MDTDSFLYLEVHWLVVLCYLVFALQHNPTLYSSGVALDLIQSLSLQLLL